MITWLLGLWRRFFARTLPSGQTPLELAELIRDLVVAMENLHGPGAANEKEFVKVHFARAVQGLLEMGRADQAAVLCKKAPALPHLPFRTLLKGIDERGGLKLAIACMRREDWSTSLRLLDWSLSVSTDKRFRTRIRAASEKIARHILRQDEATFQAKIVTLQLSPELSAVVFAAARRAG